MANRNDRAPQRPHRAPTAATVVRANVRGVEQMEPRLALSAEPVLVGAVYIEEDLGSDLHGDTFALTFLGGAPGTQLRSVEINGDRLVPGFSAGDVFWDTVKDPHGYGADDAMAFRVVEATGFAIADVRAVVRDGETLLHLDLENFEAGDKLTFTIDVDEAQNFDPTDTDLTLINEGFDPITSGVEFQGSTFSAVFAAPDFQAATATSEFVNRYDPLLNGTGLNLPADDAGGKRDRSTGTVATVTQAVIPAQLSGHVYHDANMNGRRDPGETLLAGVTVKAVPLATILDQTVRTTVTDANGRYHFADLMPGTYQVIEEQPPGYLDWLDQPGTVDGKAVGKAVNPGDLIDDVLLHGGSTGEDYDFGEILPVSIAGRVQLATPDGDCFSDTVQHAPVANALVQLLDDSGHVVDETRTDADGRYTFSQLAPGNYRVREVTPAGLLEGGARRGLVNGVDRGVVINANEVDQVDLLSGERITRVDFCELQPVSVRGSVHLATSDGDCFSESVDHTPLAGVTIQLRDSQGNEVARTTTDTQGRYEFLDLPPGTYTIFELTPIGYIDGGAMLGTVDGSLPELATVLDANTISDLELGSGQQAVDFQFCEFPPSTLSGYVYHDRDNNGVRKTDDEGIGNVTVALVDATGATVATAVTDAQGRYEFKDLRAGTYTLVETQPDGWRDGQDTPGTINQQVVGRALQDDTLSDIVLAWGQTGVEYNFGELLANSLTGNVHLATTDGDCFSETVEHPPLADVKVQLLDAAGNVIDETVTDHDGNYQFENLEAGNYTVRELTPTGVIDGGARVGDLNGQAIGRVVDPSVVVDLILASGDAVSHVDFCEFKPSSLSGKVYADDDDNGVPTDDEAGIAAVQVILFGSDGQEVARTQTDAQGVYLFENLRSDTYRIVEVQPAGWLDGKDQVGTVNGQPRGQWVNDAQRDAIQDVQLGWGESGVDYDFGELQPIEISGRVHADGLESCAYNDTTATPLRGITIELLNANDVVVQRTTTDDAGMFHFGELPPGRYTLREIQPEDLFNRGQQVGNKGGNDAVTNQLSEIYLFSGDHAERYLFCEDTPAELSGYVFQDGSTITLQKGESLPEDLSVIRDGRLTADDRRLGGIVVELREGTTFAPIRSDVVPEGVGVGALPGRYTTEYIQTTTDENGFYRFTGLHRGTYGVKEQQPGNYIDSLDTAGPTTAIAINRNNIKLIDPVLLANLTEDHQFDAIIAIQLPAGAAVPNNNFSEIKTDAPPPIWIARSPQHPPIQPLEQAPTLIPAALPAPELNPLSYRPNAFGRFRGVWANTWHLSVLDGGQPRGEGLIVDDQGPVWFDHNEEYYVAWQNDQSQQLHWVMFVDSKLYRERLFGVADGIVIAGDFNGDGLDEIGVFHEGQWFIDINGNGKWDRADIWVKLGHRGDQPVVGDWNGDGKDDVGIFGLAWPGDRRAIHREPGLPDLENHQQGEEKNLPPPSEEATQGRREMRLTSRGDTRSDVIDHVFHYGTTGDKAVVGDWNGDGIANVGIFHNGVWHLDKDGDGQFKRDVDLEVEFGKMGDQPVVGDFNGDGVDEIGILSEGKLILDTNRNYRVDEGDRVLAVNEPNARPVVGDWNGDGLDDIALVYDNLEFIEVKTRK